MATRKTTLYWKENKNQYTRCLCYSDKCGLYTDTIPEGENPDELLYRPQGYAGYVINKIEIPGRNIEITILSNFGYGSASYLRASINFGNRRILDFDLSKIYVLNNCSITTIDVPTYNWNLLFEKIIDDFISDCIIPITKKLDVQTGDLVREFWEYVIRFLMDYFFDKNESDKR